jgi:molybdopterin-guanine dinucleotide biosynthesis protein
VILLIEHIFIKNYKAFEKENVPLDKHTILIGTNASGKTTLLEALDLFFNHQMRRDYIRHLNQDVIIEIHIDDNRYRKVYSPPDYQLNFAKCIGQMFDINHLQYLYIPHPISNPKLLNDILSINLTKELSPQEQMRIFKVSDYIDGVVGNSNYPLFDYKTTVHMNIKEDLQFTRAEYAKIVSNITYRYLILGIDNVEQSFDLQTLQNNTKYMYQTIYSSNDKKLMKTPGYYVSALYKGDKDDDFDTIKKRLHSKQKTTYILVEGKYDVNWFETAIKILGKEDAYTVIPCGGYGNISYVKLQLEKEGYHTITFTDGDANRASSLSKDVIELYADPDYFNQRFHTKFTEMPTTKHQLFKATHVKDDVVKNILSRWAKKNLTIEHPFVQEVASRLQLK